MNETPAATPRVHAGCGHLCLTCGAQAAVRAVTSDVVINVCIIVSLAVATLLASVLISHVIDLAVQEYTARQKPVPVVQKSWVLASRVTLRADAEGRASFTAPEGSLCSAAFSDGRTVSAGDRTRAGETIHVVGAEPGSVIHVVCW